MPIEDNHIPVKRIGVDEAGKGPVLGPMVAAAVWADPAILPDDVDDSKRVSPSRREAIDATLRERDDVDIGVGTVEPSEIDDPETNMNMLTVAVQARAVCDLWGSVSDPGSSSTSDATADGDLTSDSGDPLQLVVDAGDVSAERFGRRVTEAIADLSDPPVEVTAEHGADETYPIVSAASVVAKVARDSRMAAINDAYPGYDDVGSGYPSDPKTTAFLASYVADCGAVPDCARRSWATCDRLLAAADQSGLDEF